MVKVSVLNAVGGTLILHRGQFSSFVYISVLSGKYMDRDVISGRVWGCVMFSCRNEA